MARAVIKKVAGKIQMNKVSSANKKPPLLKAINTTVWVDEAPGNS